MSIGPARRGEEREGNDGISYLLCHFSVLSMLRFSKRFLHLSALALKNEEEEEKTCPVRLWPGDWLHVIFSVQIALSLI